MTLAAPPSATELLAWLRLARSDGIGPLTFAGLIARFGSAPAALDALPHLQRRRGGTLRIATVEEVQRELERAAQRGWRFLISAEPDYPATLRAIEGAPPVLSLAGSVAVLRRPTVAVVGARNASGTGLRFTERLALGLGGAGFVVVSGLARGIDAQAHKAALTTGTVAVLAGGLERVYPPEHGALAEKIVAEGGAVLSEMPLGWEARGRDFPRRNRIVSGLGLGTVVVEAARRSGSLITARLANEQGREVFAVPGSPLDPRAEGTNDLLRQGATFCTGAADIIDALDPLRAQAHPDIAKPAARFRDEPGIDLRHLLDEEAGPEDMAAPEDAPPALAPRARILSLLGPVPMELDEIIRRSGLRPGEVRALLAELQFEDRIEVGDDGFVSCAGP